MRTAISLAAVAAALAAAAPANAAVVTFELGELVTGDAPSGAPTLTFADNGMDMVRLTIDAAGLSDAEFISNVFFNVANVALPLSFTFNDPLSTGPDALDGITQNSNDVDSGPARGFDIQLAFVTSNRNGGAVRFNADEVVVFDVTAAGLDALDFNVLSTGIGGNDTQFFGLARVQGIGPGANGSARVGDTNPDDNIDPGPGPDPVPEPATLALFGLGLLGLSRIRRR